MHLLRLFFVFVLLGLLGCQPARRTEPAMVAMRAAPTVAEPIPLPAHPRLILLDQDLSAHRAAIETDERLAETYETLLDQSRRAVGEPPPQYRGSHEHLLAAARGTLNRVATLGLMYRLTGERSFAEQVRQEMLAVSRFPRWTVERFLPAAEMTAAMGIGYDWLHDYLSEEDRAIIRQAIIHHGLRPALRSYQAQDGWTVSDTNHNLVGNGGVLLGALAIADDEPDLAAEIIAHSRDSIRHGMSGYAPDGAWVEGPLYWVYATRYTTFYLAAMQTATGRADPLLGAAGFDRTGLFRIHGTGPSGMTFNFGDAHAELHPAPFMYWLAAAQDLPILAAHERFATAEVASPWELIWAAQVRADDFVDAAARELPTSAYFRGVECAFLRGAWDDPQTTWVAVKGGTNPHRGTHQHLDLGTFVLDALGERWAVALGADDYGLSGYFGQRRWSYYRAATHGQNTLTFDGRNQARGAHAPITAFKDGEQFAFAVIDLSAAYVPRIGDGSVMRGVALLDGRDVLVQDDIQTTRATVIQWNFHTPADVELRRREAVLRLNGRTLHARILAPQNARFELLGGDFPAGDDPQDVRNLAIRLPRTVGRTRVAVLFTPDEASRILPMRPVRLWGRNDP